MGVIVQDSIEIIDFTDITDLKTWYIAVLRTSSAPTVADSATEAEMTTNGWSTTEPDVDVTKKLYTVQQCIFGDGKYRWGDVSLSSSYEAAIQAYNKAQTAQENADAAQTAADNLDGKTFGTITYEYTVSGTTYTVFKNEDGTYYYLDANENEVAVAESALTRDNDGYIKINRLDDGIDADVDRVSERVSTLSDELVDTNQSVSDLGDVVAANKTIAEQNSLIAREYAKIESGKLTFYGDNSQGDNVSRLELSSTAVDLKAAGVSVASMRNENGQGIMSAANMEQTFIKMKPTGADAIFQWIAQSNGHLSLKKL